MTEGRPRAPAGLGSRGRRFWNRTVAAYALTDAERELLVEACRALDECDALAAVIAEEGFSATGSQGQQRVHPAVTELRQLRLVVGRLLAQLALPEDDEDGVPSPATLRGRHAAETRWRRRDALAARRKAADGPT